MPGNTRCKCGANVSAASTLWGKTIPCPTCGDPIRPPKVEPTFPPWLESLGRTVQCVYIGGFALGIVLALARPDGGLWSGLGGMFSVVVVIVTIELAADRVVQEIRRLRVRESLRSRRMIHPRVPIPPMILA